MREWLDQYASTDDLNEKYRLLRREMTRLRAAAGGDDRFNPEAVEATVRALSEKVEGHLVVFVANDFGLPIAFRPSALDRAIQNQIRQAVLDEKYDEHEDLDRLRAQLLERYPAVHKAIVAEYHDGEVRYHLPEGSSERTNFLTVREMVGLVDYTTNSSQGDHQSRGY